MLSIVYYFVINFDKLFVAVVFFDDFFFSFCEKKDGMSIIPLNSLCWCIEKVF